MALGTLEGTRKEGQARSDIEIKFLNHVLSSATECTRVSWYIRCTPHTHTAGDNTHPRHTVVFPVKPRLDATIRIA